MGAADIAERINIHLRPEQFQVLLEAVQASALCTLKAELRAQREELLNYLFNRTDDAETLEAPEPADVDEVWRDVWIARVFKGREPTIDQIKRELFEYWELLEVIDECA
jgi:hypothetical protein